MKELKGDNVNIVNGNKNLLLNEFNQLRVIHGRKWRQLLVKHNDWHNTTEGLYAWQNAIKGKAGNEVLRLIISDMRAIIKKPAKNKILKSIGFKHKTYS